MKKRGVRCLGPALPVGPARCLCCPWCRFPWCPARWPCPLPAARCWVLSLPASYVSEDSPGVPLRSASPALGCPYALSHRRIALRKQAAMRKGMRGCASAGGGAKAARSPEPESGHEGRKKPFQWQRRSAKGQRLSPRDSIHWKGGTSPEHAPVCHSPAARQWKTCEWPNDHELSGIRHLRQEGFPQVSVRISLQRLVRPRPT